MALNQTIPTLKQILDVENAPVFWEVVCPSTGVLVWPTIRNVFFRMIMSDLLYTSQPVVATSRRTALHQVGLKTLRALVHNLFNKPWHAPVLIYATGGGLLEKEGKSFNRYTGYFTDFFDGATWSLEGVPRQGWSLPRFRGGMSFWYPMAAGAALYSRVAVREVQRRYAAELVNVAADRANDLIDWDLDKNRKDWLIRACARQTAAYPLLRMYMERMLRRVRPKLFLVEEGCYGSKAMFNVTAKEEGVTVAEFQHGVVSAGHDAYNVAPLLAKSKAYRQTMPEYFLSYGRWWNDQFNAPVNKFEIGNPHREALLQNIAVKGSDSRIVLVLGEGIETDFYLDWCRDLSKALSTTYRVLFRPHPLERNRVIHLDSSRFKGFEVDLELDIYPALAMAHAVIAELSTGLFEAAGLTDRIFVWSTPKSNFGLPVNPFAEFEDIEDLAHQLINTDTGRVSNISIEAFWANNWRGRFKHFIDSVYSGKCYAMLSTARDKSENHRTIASIAR